MRDINWVLCHIWRLYWIDVFSEVYSPRNFTTEWQTLWETCRDVFSLTSQVHCCNDFLVNWMACLESPFSWMGPLTFMISLMNSLKNSVLMKLYFFCRCRALRSQSSPWLLSWRSSCCQKFTPNLNLSESVHTIAWRPCLPVSDGVRETAVISIQTALFPVEYRHRRK